LVEGVQEGKERTGQIQFSPKFGGDELCPGAGFGLDNAALRRTALFCRRVLKF